MRWLGPIRAGSQWTRYTNRPFPHDDDVRAEAASRLAQQNALLQDQATELELQQEQLQSQATEPEMHLLSLVNDILNFARLESAA